MTSNQYYETITHREEAFYLQGALDHFNERIRIDYYLGNISDLVTKVEALAEAYNYTKIIIKVRKEHLHTFLQFGYVMEAFLQSYFQGSDGYFVTKYRDEKRRNSGEWVKEDNIVSAILHTTVFKEKSVPKEYVLRKAKKEDATELAALYGHVFEVYPTPLNQADYIEKTMEEGTIYYVYEKEGRIVSAASAELDVVQRNAELTNCATLEEHRNYGLMKELLKKLEEELFNRAIYCSYTIARSLSYGMNAAFHQLGYTYTGRLTNNCYIFDKLEDMNVWVKDLSIRL
ncbi:putative beta-lysine N-acetyltransferase [Bacillus sp. 165]|uniref:putative beta-lysine N-acetyltransferase n=1 Tax=Bacillus sp. 165 TaxID=1529117 RepID=UPI001ADCC964|nr:putative beta-lysine N-acetyltransferase [Bacillus sp. 165]MBO9130429.1 putative beta-lysine N-acetyltransferase [Bacillus sp. 165]